MLNWVGVHNLNSKQYKCGYCGNPLASEKGFPASAPNGRSIAYIYICHYCFQPTFFDLNNNQTPGPTYGYTVQDVPNKEVESLYDEARRCMANNAYTAAVLCCRKLLMNIAVSKGEKTGLRFIEYIEFLSSKGFVPPDGKGWVDHIRNKGNEATHEIQIMLREDAEELIDFIGMLLKFIYEFPATINKKIAAANKP